MYSLLNTNPGLGKVARMGNYAPMDTSVSGGVSVLPVSSVVSAELTPVQSFQQWLQLSTQGIPNSLIAAFSAGVALFLLVKRR
jgi:hypothetical protein